MTLLKRDCFVAALLAMTAWFAPFALAGDLSLKAEDVRFLPPQPIQFEPVTVEGKIHNGAERAGIAEVVFSADGEPSGRVKVALTPGKDETFLFHWEPQSPGIHELKILLDPKNEWQGEDQGNRQLVMKVEVDPFEGKPEATSTRRKKAVYPYYPF